MALAGIPKPKEILSRSNGFDSNERRLPEIVLAVSGEEEGCPGLVGRRAFTKSAFNRRAAIGFTGNGWSDLIARNKNGAI